MDLSKEIENEWELTKMMVEHVLCTELDEYTLERTETAIMIRDGFLTEEADIQNAQKNLNEKRSGTIKNAIKKVLTSIQKLTQKASLSIKKRKLKKHLGFDKKYNEAYKKEKVMIYDFEKVMKFTRTTYNEIEKIANEIANMNSKMFTGTKIEHKLKKLPSIHDKQVFTKKEVPLDAAIIYAENISQFLIRSGDEMYKEMGRICKNIEKNVDRLSDSGENGNKKARALMSCIYLMGDVTSETERVIVTKANEMFDEINRKSDKIMEQIQIGTNGQMQKMPPSEKPTTSSEYNVKITKQDGK